MPVAPPAGYEAVPPAPAAMLPTAQAPATAVETAAAQEESGDESGSSDDDEEEKRSAIGSFFRPLEPAEDDGDFQKEVSSFILGSLAPPDQPGPKRPFGSAPAPVPASLTVRSAKPKYTQNSYWCCAPSGGSLSDI